MFIFGDPKKKIWIKTSFLFCTSIFFLLLGSILLIDFAGFQCQQLDEKSKEKAPILKEITERMVHKAYLDSSIDFIGKLIFGEDTGPSIIATSRAAKHPLVDG